MADKTTSKGASASAAQSVNTPKNKRKDGSSSSARVNPFPRKPKASATGAATGTPIRPFGRKSK